MALETNDKFGCIRFNKKTKKYYSDNTVTVNSPEIIKCHLHIVSSDFPELGKGAAYYDEIENKWKSVIASEEDVERPWILKIIASTDKSLNVIEIPSELIKEFCDNQGAMTSIRVLYNFSKFIH